MQDSHRKYPGVLLLGFLIVLVGTNLVNYFMFGFQPSSPLPVGQNEQNAGYDPIKLGQELELLEEVFELIREHYVNPVDLPLLVRGAIRGALESLGDPNTVFYDARELEEFSIRATGSFEGIGVRIIEVEGNVVVFETIPGTPAERVGLYPGDRICNAGGEELAGQGIQRAAELIRGPQGSSVILIVERPGDSAPLTFSVERDKVNMVTVLSRLLEPGLGYIHITNFDSSTGSEFTQQFQQLETAGLHNGLILDLRGNGGGQVYEALKVARLLVPAGEITRLVGRDGEVLQIEYSHAPAKPYPIVVLVNEESASAAEIVAGALWDHGAALLVGAKTYGKATVQKSQYLPGGNALKISMSKYLTPLGHDLHGQGLEPDFPVEMPAVLNYYRVFLPWSLAQGSYGMEVKMLQEILSELGFHVANSGYFDAATAAALAEFQAGEGLDPSGVFDDLAWLRLRAALDKAARERDPQLLRAIELTRQPGLWANDGRP